MHAHRWSFLNYCIHSWSLQSSGSVSHSGLMLLDSSSYHTVLRSVSVCRLEPMLTFWNPMLVFPDELTYVFWTRSASFNMYTVNLIKSNSIFRFKVIPSTIVKIRQKINCYSQKWPFPFSWGSYLYAIFFLCALFSFLYPWSHNMCSCTHTSVLFSLTLTYFL